jgi:acyl-CoA synthetase (NDP forming)
MSCYRGLASDQKAVDGAGCYHFCYHIPVYGHLAFVSQSGALCSSVLDWSIRERVGF